MFESTDLAIIKGSLNGNVVHISVLDSGHLSLLDRADLALGVHDEHADILLAAQTVNSCGASVTTGCADNSQVFPVLARLILALVPANEEVLEEVSQKLEGNILKSKGWAVEQLEQMEVLLLVESCDGNNVVGTECSVALSDDFLQICFRNLLARDIEGEDLKPKILERQVPPFGMPVASQGGDFFRDEEAAIVGETLQDDIFE